MPRPVSIITWRDAKSDPPTLDGSYLVKDGDYPTVLWGYDTEEGVWFIRGEIHALVMDPPTVWAEWPEPGKATVDDVQDAIEALEYDYRFDDHVGLIWERKQNDSADRLRAALGGEKEEA